MWYIYANVWLYIYICIYIFVYTYIYINIHIYIYTYIAYPVLTYVYTPKHTEPYRKPWIEASRYARIRISKHHLHISNIQHLSRMSKPSWIIVPTTFMKAHLDNLDCTSSNTIHNSNDNRQWKTTSMYTFAFIYMYI